MPSEPEREEDISHLCEEDREILLNLSKSVKELSDEMNPSSISTSQREINIESRLSKVESKLNILIGVIGAIGAPSLIAITIFVVKTLMGS